MVYSTGTWFVWERDDPEWKRAKLQGSFHFENGVWFDRPPQLLMRWPRFHAWDRFAVAAQARRLRTFSKRSRQGPLIGYVFHPEFIDYVEALAPDICVYHAYDLFRSTPGWDRAKASQERRLLQCADLVLASSRSIADALAGDAAKDVVVLPNGADVRAFSDAADSANASPDDVAVIPHPRIGYVGNLNRKVDFELIEELARRNRPWQFVFVGRLGSFDNVGAAAVERCKLLENVHFLGHKDPGELPKYVAAMDVNIMCYRRDGNLWSAAGYPLKMHEYLAAGRPVVSTDLVSVREFTSVLALARDLNGWENHLHKALAGNGVGTKESRRAAAAQNDWDIHATTLVGYLDKLISLRAHRDSP